MTFTLRHITLLSLTVLAAGLSGWSIFLSVQSQKPILNNTSHEPDAFIENVVATMMNKQGTLSMKLETAKMIHYAEDDSAELMTPHVIIFRNSSQPWHINATHAKTKQGVNEITFWDKVVIHHLADADNPITTMNTSSLTIVPDQQIAKTSQEITVTQPNTLVHAVGMLANWEEGTVKLLSQAREEYVPSS